MKDEVLAKKKDEISAKVMKEGVLGKVMKEVAVESATQVIRRYKIWTKAIVGGITVSINFHFLLLKYTKFKGYTYIYLS